MENTIGAGEFKNRCLQILDEVGQTGIPLTITKRGKPVARLVPVTTFDEDGALDGAILHQDPDIFSTGERWGAQG